MDSRADSIPRSVSPPFFLDESIDRNIRRRAPGSGSGSLSGDGGPAEKQNQARGPPQALVLSRMNPRDGDEGTGRTAADPEEKTVAFRGGRRGGTDVFCVRSHESGRRAPFHSKARILRVEWRKEIERRGARFP